MILSNNNEEMDNSNLFYFHRGVFVLVSRCAD